jgi:hypothetical protein
MFKYKPNTKRLARKIVKKLGPIVMKIIMDSAEFYVEQEINRQLRKKSGY